MGKQEILDRVLPNGKGVWVPIDHGVTDFPCEGLGDIQQIVLDLIEGGVDVIVAHKGVVDRYSDLCEGTNTSMIAVSYTHLTLPTKRIV